MKRFLAAALAAFIFAFIYSAISYVPAGKRESNVYYFGFTETMAFVILYAGPIFTLVGIPISIMIDKLTKNKNSQYIKKLAFYSGTGVVIGALFPLVLLPGLNSIPLISLYAVIGLMAANIYYHTLLWLPFKRKAAKETRTHNRR